MATAGELLQSERTRKGVSLPELASITRINVRYLQALEADDVGQLPGPFFYKSFIRQYARALDLDAERTSAILAAATPIEQPDPVPVLNQSWQNAQTGEPARPRLSAMLAVGLLIAALIGGSALYAIWNRAQQQEEATAEAPSEPGQDRAVSAGPVSTAPPQGAAPQVPSDAPAAQSSGSEESKSPAETAGTTAAPVAPASAGDTGGVERTRPATEPASEPAPVPRATLHLTAVEPVWVSVSSADRLVWTGTLQPDAPKQFTVQGDTRVVTGNAGNLSLRWNGRAIGNIGPKGQVRTVLLSGDSVQVVTPQRRAPSSGGGTRPVQQPTGPSVSN